LQLIIAMSQTELASLTCASPQKNRTLRDHLIAQKDSVPNAAPVHTELSSARFPSRDDRRIFWPTLTFSILIAIVTGASMSSCTSEPSENSDLLRRVLPPQPMLMQSAAYDGGALTVGGWLGPTVRLNKTGKNGAQTGGPTPADHAGPALNPNDGPFRQGPDTYSAAEINEMYGRKDYEHVVPPRSALVLRFTNTSAQSITFRISDVNSTLGDFVPRPETLTVAPGGQGSVEPMLSNLNSDFDELDVTVTLRFGEKTETHVLKLRPGE
jgi:hypothetical protein